MTISPLICRALMLINCRSYRGQSTGHDMTNTAIYSYKLKTLSLDAGLLSKVGTLQIILRCEANARNCPLRPTTAREYPAVQPNPAPVQ